MLCFPQKGQRIGWITFQKTCFPSLPPSYLWCWGLSGICDWQLHHEAPASCSVQEFQRPLQPRFPALTITANRICPLSLAPGSDQPCVKLVGFLEITGEENTLVRWCGLQASCAPGHSRAMVGNKGKTLGKTEVFLSKQVAIPYISLVQRQLAMVNWK